MRSTTFIDGGYDRQPDFTIGVTNTLTLRAGSPQLPVDIRKGGDIFNATEHFLTARGLTHAHARSRQPRVIEGVLRDGKENTANPTKNNIVVVPALRPGYYTAIERGAVHREGHQLAAPARHHAQLPAARAALRPASSVFLTGTDLLLFTNYSGLDPIVNGNTAAVGGSGASASTTATSPCRAASTSASRMAF